VLSYVGFVEESYNDLVGRFGSINLASWNAYRTLTSLIEPEELVGLEEVAVDLANEQLIGRR
jgi:hypothetical protein